MTHKKLPAKRMNYYLYTALLGKIILPLCLLMSHLAPISSFPRQTANPGLPSRNLRGITIVSAGNTHLETVVFTGWLACNLLTFLRLVPAPHGSHFVMVPTPCSQNSKSLHRLNKTEFLIYCTAKRQIELQMSTHAGLPEVFIVCVVWTANKFCQIKQLEAMMNPNTSLNRILEVIWT